MKERGQKEWKDYRESFPDTKQWPEGADPATKLGLPCPRKNGSQAVQTYQARKEEQGSM